MGDREATTLTFVQGGCRHQRLHRRYALVASTGHAVRLFPADTEELGTIVSLPLFTVPVVTAGGQIGSAVARSYPRAMVAGVQSFCILAAAPMLGEATLDVRQRGLA